MAKRMPHVDAAKAEALRLGAELCIITIDHHVKGVIKYGGQSRKIFISKTPSDGRAFMNIKEDVRKKVKEMVG